MGWCAPKPQSMAAGHDRREEAAAGCPTLSSLALLLSTAVLALITLAPAQLRWVNASLFAQLLQRSGAPLPPWPSSQRPT